MDHAADRDALTKDLLRGGNTVRVGPWPIHRQGVPRVGLDDPHIDLHARGNHALLFQRRTAGPGGALGESQAERLMLQLEHGLKMRRTIRLFKAQRAEEPFLSRHGSGPFGSAFVRTSRQRSAIRLMPASVG